MVRARSGNAPFEMHPNDEWAPRLRRAKIAVTAVFIAHAVGFSSWAAHIPHVKAELGLSDAALGTALFGAPVGSVVATLGSHWVLMSIVGIAIGCATAFDRADEFHRQVVTPAA